jgi:hypothetical protein
MHLSVLADLARMQDTTPVTILYGIFTSDGGILCHRVIRVGVKSEM